MKAITTTHIKHKSHETDQHRYANISLYDQLIDYCSYSFVLEYVTLVGFIESLPSKDNMQICD